MLHIVLFIALFGADCPADASCAPGVLLSQAAPAEEIASPDPVEGDFEAWLRAGVGALRQRQPEAALESLDRALEIAVDENSRLKALAFRSLALLRLGRIQAALAQSESMRSRPSASRGKSAPRAALGVAHLVEGLARAKLGTVEQAERVLGEALRKYQGELALEDLVVEAWLTRGELLTRRGRHEKSLQAYKQAARPLSPRWRQETWRHLLRVRAVQAQGLALARLGRREEQLVLLDRFLAAYAESALFPGLRMLLLRLNLQKSEALEASGKIREAVQALAGLAKEVEDNGPGKARFLAAQARLRQGLLLRRLKDYEKALEIYSVLAERYAGADSLTQRQLAAEARIQRAATLVETRRLDDARATLRRLGESLGDDEEGDLRAYAVRALLLRAQLEESEEAEATAELEHRLALLERIDQDFSADPSPRVQEQLLEIIEHRSTLLRDAGRLLDTLVLLEQGAQRYAEAEDLALLEGWTRLLFSKSVLLDRVGLPEKAHEAVQEALHRFDKMESTPEVQAARLRLQARRGLLLYSQQRWQEVLAVLDPLLQSQTRVAEMEEASRVAFAEAWLYRNIAIAITGRLREGNTSLEAMIEAFRLDPLPRVKYLVLQAYLHRSQMLLQLQQPGKGRALLDVALKAYGDTNEPLLRESVADLRMERAILVARGDRNAGLQAFQEVAERYADADASVLRRQGAAALLGRAELLRATGRQEEAEQQAKRAVDILREIQSPFLKDAERRLDSLRAE